jgi:sialate O-acetylesterase
MIPARQIPCILSFFFVCAVARADIKLPAIFSDHMALERSGKTPIWGKADPDEQVAITVGEKTFKTKAGSDGKWRVELDLTKSAEGPVDLTIAGRNAITIRDVVIGEVWLASGQSNMEFQLKNAIAAAAEIAQSANPFLRQFRVAKRALPAPADECAGEWTVANPETSGDFSAVGYFYGKKLQQELHVPIGIINASWGGTFSEAWTSKEAIDKVEKLRAWNEAERKLTAEYPAKKQAFVAAFTGWLKANGREDKPSPAPDLFAGMEVSKEGWAPITLPSQPSRKDSLGNGAFWIRKEIDVPASVVGKEIKVNLGDVRGFDRVFWNGRKVFETTYQTYPGAGFKSYFPIPVSLLRKGVNVLAVRIYSPAEPAALVSAPLQFIAGPMNLSGEWLMKKEYELPPLDAAALAAAPKPPAPAPGLLASGIYNGVIAPLTAYAISGVIWYQGESNTGRAYDYRVAFPLLINDWREKWNRELPFYFCQLDNMNPKSAVPTESEWSELREAQSMTLSLPNTGQAVLIDLGEANDIHARDKVDVGDRLARIALAKQYGKAIAFSGPVFESKNVEGHKVRIKFNHADGGLAAKHLPDTYPVKTILSQTAPLIRNSPGSELEGFAICGEDRKFVWADAKIEGDAVVVWSDKVSNPVAVRYAWADNPTCNLYNGAGLPASPFRTDDFPGRTAPK